MLRKILVLLLKLANFCGISIKIIRRSEFMRESSILRH